MIYFTLKYFDPLSPTDTPGFIITEETSPLTTTKIFEISSLVQSVITTHAICLSVPASFLLNLETHSNTLFLLEGVMLTLKQQLEENEDNEPIQDALTSLYSHLLTDSGLDFQQPPPITIDDLANVKVFQPKVPVPQKRASSSSNLFIGASKKCKPFYPYCDSLNNNPALQPETSGLTQQTSPKEYLEKNQSSPTSIEILKNIPTHTLPVIELIPEKNRFIITFLVISDVESYLELLHANIFLILKNELFFLDTMADIAKSQTSLFYETLQTLLSLLHQQEISIKSIPDLRRKEAITSEHFILTNEIVIRLQAAGFSDNAIGTATESNVSTQSTELYIKDFTQEDPKSSPESPSYEPLVNLISDRSSSTQSLSPPSTEDITPASEHTPHYMPLCFIKVIKTFKSQPKSHLKSCYTLVYQVKKNNTSLTNCYSSCRKSIAILLSAITNLCSNDNSETFGLSYISPKTKKTIKINKIEMLQHVFIGLQENISFLKNHHPRFLKATSTHDPFADLKSSLELVRNALKDNVPTEQPSDILIQVLEEAKKKYTSSILAPIKKKKLLPIQEATPRVIPSKITSIMPIFSSSLKTFSSKKTTLRVTCCTFYYQLRTTAGPSYKLLAHIRRNIHILVQNVESLLTLSSKENHLVNLKYIPPFQEKSIPISQNQALLTLFEGLNENLNFLHTACPDIFIPTKIYNPKTALEKALLLVKNAFSTPLPSPKQPSILPALLEKGLQKYLKVIPMTNNPLH
ncbi:hypothetical protein CLAVI_000911 [Candidatus Clavichlamydia salmonicola]|uniref:hypothetical protein n=1 Tax=Candidatus Clavichlamydia salmonicola TaxID=469812 RepID=UPI001891DD86|nr:hypothetical protein [Candidatus Clavichlamydia salmonicola]MBF5051270.1 hypothetical protein [Candidatus Clavichlamydia salmonicola]